MPRSRHSRLPIQFELGCSQSIICRIHRCSHSSSRHACVQHLPLRLLKLLFSLLLAETGLVVSRVSGTSSAFDTVSQRILLHGSTTKLDLHVTNALYRTCEGTHTRSLIRSDLESNDRRTTSSYASAYRRTLHTPSVKHLLHCALIVDNLFAESLHVL